MCFQIFLPQSASIWRDVISPLYARNSTWGNGDVRKFKTKNDSYSNFPYMYPTWNINTSAGTLLIARMNQQHVTEFNSFFHIDAPTTRRIPLTRIFAELISIVFTDPC